MTTIQWNQEYKDFIRKNLYLTLFYLHWSATVVQGVGLGSVWPDGLLHLRPVLVSAPSVLRLTPPPAGSKIH